MARPVSTASQTAQLQCCYTSSVWRTVQLCVSKNPGQHRHASLVSAGLEHRVRGSEGQAGTTLTLAPRGGSCLATSSCIYSCIYFFVLCGDQGFSCTSLLRWCSVLSHYTGCPLTLPHQCPQLTNHTGILSHSFLLHRIRETIGSTTQMTVRGQAHGAHSTAMRQSHSCQTLLHTQHMTYTGAQLKRGMLGSEKPEC